MRIDRKDIDQLNLQLNITLEPEDYKTKFENELIRQGKKVQIKGFRKGKVPKSYLKKAFGKSILADVVLSEISQALSEYIRDNKLNTLGRPIQSEDQPLMEFDPNDLGSYDFSFDIGLEPEFDVKGVSKSDVYTKAVIDVPDSEVDEEMENAQKRMGKEIDVEEGIEENDRVELEAKEVTDAEEGHEATFQVLVNMLGDDQVKKTLQESKVGDELTINPFTLEKNAKPEYVRKHMLAIEDEDADIGEEWKAVIKSVKRIEKAEVNEEFLKSFFGEEVKSEEEGRERLREHISGFYDRQGEALLYRSFQDALLEKNDISLPADFLRRWLTSEKEQQNANQEEQISTEVTDEEWNDFAKGLKWTIIRDKIAEQGEVEVTEDELRNHFMNSIRQYLGAYAADESLLRHSAERMMQNQEQVRKAYETIKDDKVFQYIASQVKVEEDKIDKGELEKRIEAARQ